MRAVMLLVCSVLLFGKADAAEPERQFASAEQKALYVQLTHELRCPKCQNQNIAESDAPIAQDLRRKVHELIEQGQNKDQVVAFMKQRYGDFVHYQPPLTPLTAWLWLLPLIFVLLGVYLVRGRSRQSALSDEDKLAKANRLLGDDK